MFTKMTLVGLRTYFTIQNLLKSGPYKWRDDYIHVHASVIHRVLFALSTLWFAIRTLYYPVGLIQQLLKGLTGKYLVYGVFLLEFFWAMALYQINTIKYAGLIREFFNAMLYFNRDVSMSLMGRVNPVKKDGCTRFIWMMIIAALVNPLMDVISDYRRDPLSSRFLYRYIAKDRRRTPLFYAFGVLELYGNILGWYPWLMIFFLIWTYTKSTTFWLKQMRFGANRRLTEHPKEVIQLYQRLQILNLQFNDCFATLGMPVFVAQNIFTHVLVLLLTFRHHHEYPPSMKIAMVFWSLMWFWLEGVVYTMLGGVSYYSKSCVKSWTDVLGVKSRKKLKSLPPLGVKISSIYVIHRATVLAVILQVVNLTVQLLLLN